MAEVVEAGLGVAAFAGGLGGGGAGGVEGLLGGGQGGGGGGSLRFRALLFLLGGVERLAALLFLRRQFG